MNCVMCFSTASSLLLLPQHLDKNTLKKIAFVLPDSILPDLQDPIYACATCIDQLTYFYNIKKSCLKNLSHFKHSKDILKKTSDVKFNELKILINCEEVSTSHEKDKEFKLNSNFHDILSSKDAEVDQISEKFCNSSTGEGSKIQREHKKRRFKCRECDKMFTYRCKLVQHIRIHTRERPYKCPTCQKTFTWSSNLNKHKATHTGENPPECHICHKTFLHKSNLVTHERTHTNERPYKCSVCNKTFTWSSSLIVHMRTHTGDKPHQCRVCQYKCTTADNLKKHIRTHTGEKPFSCSICKKSFAQSSNLNKHERIFHND